MSNYKALASIPLSQVKTLKVNEVVEPLQLDSPATSLTFKVLACDRF